MALEKLIETGDFRGIIKNHHVSLLNEAPCNDVKVLSLGDSYVLFILPRDIAS